MRKKKVGLSYVNITHIHPVLNLFFNSYFASFRRIY